MINFETLSIMYITLTSHVYKYTYSCIATTESLEPTSIQVATFDRAYSADAASLEV